MKGSARDACRTWQWALARHASRVVLSASLLSASTLGACKPERARQPEAPEPDRISIFEGSVHLANGKELQYRAILAPDPAAPGQHIGTIDIPMQGLWGASIERIVFEKRRRIELTLALPGAPRWAGVFAADGTIACEFRQGDVRLLCSMNDVRVPRGTPPVLKGYAPAPPADAEQ